MLISAVQQCKLQVCVYPLPLSLPPIHTLKPTPLGWHGAWSWVCEACTLLEDTKVPAPVAALNTKMFPRRNPIAFGSCMLLPFAPPSFFQILKNNFKILCELLFLHFPFIFLEGTPNSDIPLISSSHPSTSILLLNLTSWQIMGKQWKQWLTLFFWAPKSLQMVIVAMKLKDAYSLEGKLWPT